MRRALPFALLPLLATACADPQGEFDAFTERKGPAVFDSDLPPCGEGDVATPADVAGTYVFGISPVPLNAESSIYFVARASDDAGKLNLKFTAIKAYRRGETTGEEFDIGSYEIDSRGHFEAKLPPLTVVGAANPVSQCVAITAEVTLTGRFCKSAMACPALEGGAPSASLQPPSFHWGLVSGNVTRPTPLKLDGSIFTMQRVASATDRPATYVIDCTGASAAAETTEVCE